MSQTINPLDLGDTFDTDNDIEAGAVSVADADVASALDECFVLQADNLSEWEDRFSITPTTGDTATRRANILAKKRAVGDHKKSYFEQIATGYGYKIGTHGEVGDPHLRIVEGAYPPFRADYGESDVDAVWDQNSGNASFTILVYGTNVSLNDPLMDQFEAIKTLGTEFAFDDE